MCCQTEMARDVVSNAVRVAADMTTSELVVRFELMILLSSGKHIEIIAIHN